MGPGLEHHWPILGYRNGGGLSNISACKLHEPSRECPKAEARMTVNINFRYV